MATLEEKFPDGVRADTNRAVRPIRGNPNWKKGVSANPGGRTSDSWKIVHAIQHYGPELIAKLVQISRDDKHRRQFDAINVLLDRGYGRASTPVELTGQGGGPLVLATWAEMAKEARTVLDLPGPVVDAPEKENE